MSSQSAASSTSALNRQFSPRLIVCPIDGSENSIRAVGVGASLAKLFGSELLLIAVVSIPMMGVETPGAGFTLEDYRRSVESDLEKAIENGLQVARQAGINASGEVIQNSTSVVHSIIDTSEKKQADLIVIGTRGLGGFKRLVLGSVSDGVVSHAHCSILVLRFRDSRSLTLLRGWG